MDKHLNILKQLLEWWWDKDAILFGKFDDKSQNIVRACIYDYLKN